MEATELARRTEQHASRDVGTREIPANSNDGPRVRDYLAYTGVPVGSPYCASACSLWVHEAAVELGLTASFKKSARALGLWERNPELAILPKDLTPEMLPVVAIMDHGGGKGHAYLAIGWDQATGLLQSVDPNSNPHGSREGGGVYSLDIRSIHDTQLKGFIRIF